MLGSEYAEGAVDPLQGIVKGKCTDRGADDGKSNELEEGDGKRREQVRSLSLCQTLNALRSDSRAGTVVNDRGPATLASSSQYFSDRLSDNSVGC